MSDINEEGAQDTNLESHATGMFTSFVDTFTCRTLDFKMAITAKSHGIKSTFDLKIDPLLKIKPKFKR